MIIFNLLRRYPIIPAFIYTVLIFTAVFAPFISPQDPYKNSLSDRNVPPIGIEGSKSQYILGTDPIGRDMLSRLIYGARVSAMVMFFSIMIGITIGTTLGLISGYFGGHIDEIIMRFVDIWAALPFIMIALVVVLIYGQSFKILVALLALMSWPGPVRLVRAQTLSLKKYGLYCKCENLRSFQFQNNCQASSPWYLEYSSCCGNSEYRINYPYRNNIIFSRSWNSATYTCLGGNDCIGKKLP